MKIASEKLLSDKNFTICEEMISSLFEDYISKFLDYKLSKKSLKKVKKSLPNVVKAIIRSVFLSMINNKKIRHRSLIEEANILERHDFGDGRSRYEEVTDDHHDHLIDVKSGRVVEFQNEEIEELQNQIAKAHGMKLVGHRLELYGVPLKDDE